MIRLGGKLYLETDDPYELASAHRTFGYTAATCPKARLEQTDDLRKIREAFEREDVLLAEVGAWRNMVDADEAKRRENLKFVIEKLAIAEEVGARCCVNFIGSVAPGTVLDPDPFNLSKEGFDLCVETVRAVIDAVNPKRTRFCLEFMPWLLPDSPESCLELIQAVDRPAFAAHLDPVNVILTPRQYFHNGDFIRKCFTLLGPYIVSCHGKDITLRNKLTLHLDEVIPGQGALDYPVYLTEIAKLPGDMPLILEHMRSEEEYAMARDHLYGLGEKLGVPFYKHLRVSE